MADNLYQVGDSVPIQATFKNAAGALTNTTVSLEVRKPDGTVTTSTPTNASTGVYTSTVTPDQPGLWWYSFIGTGAVAATEQNSFVVEARYTSSYPLSTSSLLTLDEAREYVLGNRLNDTQDSKLIRRINEISAAVATYTRREWCPTVTATRTFFYRGRGPMSLGSHDLRTVTSMTIYTDLPTANQQTLLAGTTTSVGDYRLGPSGGMPPAGTYRWVTFNTILPHWNFPYFRGWQVTINGTWGIGTVPDDVKLAVKIAVRDAYENPEGGSSRNVGQISYTEQPELLDPGTPWRALPAESRALLADYRDDPLVIGV